MPPTLSGAVARQIGGSPDPHHAVHFAEPPLVANNVVFAYGNGEYTEQAFPDRGLFDNSPLRISRSTHAVLYALDPETGKELYSSGDQITSFSHFSGLSVANGRVYLGTYDSTLYCFGLSK